jgi:hypothetical protein
MYIYKYIYTSNIYLYIYTYIQWQANGFAGSHPCYEITIGLYVLLVTIKIVFYIQGSLNWVSTKIVVAWK